MQLSLIPCKLLKDHSKIINLNHLLQEDLNCICDWENKWQLRLNASKCEGFLILNKHKTISQDYLINNSPLSWGPSVKYLGDSNLSWSDHCKYVLVKASKSLNFLCHTLWGAATEAKSMHSLQVSGSTISGVCVCCVESSYCY